MIFLLFLSQKIETLKFKWIKKYNIQFNNKYNKICPITIIIRQWLAREKIILLKILNIQIVKFKMLIYRKTCKEDYLSKIIKQIF